MEALTEREQELIKRIGFLNQLREMYLRGELSLTEYQQRTSDYLRK